MGNLIGTMSRDWMTPGARRRGGERELISKREKDRKRRIYV